MRNSLELQRMVAGALIGDAALEALGIPIFDGPPVDSRGPYLSIGGDIVSARGWQGGDGREHRFTVNLWDSREGVAAAKAVLGEVERVVLSMPRQVAGLRLIGLRLLRASVRRTQRGWILGQLEFRVLSVMED